MLIKTGYRLKGLKVDKSVSMLKYWHETFTFGIADKWDVKLYDAFSPITTVNIEDTFIRAHPDTLKTRTSRNPIADWIRIISCDRERFIEDLKGVN